MRPTPKAVHVQYELIKNVASIQRKLARDVEVDENDCHIVPYTIVNDVMRGFPQDHGVSVTRVVYAIAHPTEVVRKTEVIVHICEHGTNDHSETCCINPEHIVKSTDRRDVSTMVRVRRRAMVKPSAEVRS